MGKKAGGKEKEDSMDVDVNHVRFTHSRVSPLFTGCGLPLRTTLDDIVSGRTLVTALPLITIIPLPDIVRAH